MSFDGIVAILDTAVGGPDAGVGAHGPFWRGVTRDQFIALKVFNLPLVALGDGAHSNLVLALKGQVPFGADLPGAPNDATMPRMPAGLPPVPAASIAVIEQWINDRCPDNSMSFDGIVAILDTAVGGPDAGVGAHGPFWRRVTRDQFIALKVFNLALVALGDGAHSNLVLALKGQVPFGADLPGAPNDATMPRMPAGLPPVPAASIAVIEQWINERCP